MQNAKSDTNDRIGKLLQFRPLSPSSIPLPPAPAAARLAHGVDDHGHAVAVLEGGVVGAHRPAVGHRVEEMELLDDLAMFPAEVVSLRPPGADVGMIRSRSRRFR